MQYGRGSHFEFSIMYNIECGFTQCNLKYFLFGCMYLLNQHKSYTFDSCYIKLDNIPTISHAYLLILSYI